MMLDSKSIKRGDYDDSSLSTSPLLAGAGTSSKRDPLETRQDASMPPTYMEALVDRVSHVSLTPSAVSSSKQPYHHSFMIMPATDLIAALHAILVTQTMQPHYKVVVYTHIPRFLTSLFQTSGDVGSVFHCSSHFRRAQRGVLFTKYRDDKRIETNDVTLFVWLNAPAKRRSAATMNLRIQQAHALGKQALVLVSSPEEPLIQGSTAALKMSQASVPTPAQLSLSRTTLRASFVNVPRCRHRHAWKTLHRLERRHGPCFTGLCDRMLLI